MGFRIHFFLGGFDGTSNVVAGKCYEIPLKGIPAHGYITSFDDTSELPNLELAPKYKGKPKNFTHLAMKWRAELTPVFDYLNCELNQGELAAFISLAIAFPNDFLACVNTFDIKRYPCQNNSTPPQNKYR